MICSCPSYPCILRAEFNNWSGGKFTTTHIPKQGKCATFLINACVSPFPLSSICFCKNEANYLFSFFCKVTLPSCVTSLSSLSEYLGPQRRRQKCEWISDLKLSAENKSVSPLSSPSSLSCLNNSFIFVRNGIWDFSILVNSHCHKSAGFWSERPIASAKSVELGESFPTENNATLYMQPGRHDNW